MTEHEYNVQQWLNGQELSHMVGTRAWEILQQMLDDQAASATAQLLDIKPGENDRVLAAHAAAWVVHERNTNVYDAVEHAIAFTKSTTLADLEADKEADERGNRFGVDPLAFFRP